MARAKLLGLEVISTSWLTAERNRELYISRGVAPEKIVFIPNCPDERMFLANVDPVNLRRLAAGNAADPDRPGARVKPQAFERVPARDARLPARAIRHSALVAAYPFSDFGPPGVEWAAATAAPCMTSLDRNCLYVVGGLQEYQTIAYVATDLTAMYDPKTNVWTQVSSLNAARAHLAATMAPCRMAPARNCIYAIGGLNPQPSVSYLTSVEMFSPKRNRWSFVRSFPISIADSGAATAPCAGNKGLACVYQVGEARLAIML